MIAAGGLDTLRRSQKLGVIVQLCGATQPSSTVPHDSQPSIQLPDESATTVRPVGACGPSTPVVKNADGEEVPCPLMRAVTVTS